jgi:ACS family pantothenate transporter-like MFS transporter
MIQYSWLNSTLKDNYGERGLIISSMMTLGFCCQIWVPLFTFPTVQAPRFPHGYPAATVFEVCMWSILMFGAWFMRRWKKKHPDLEMLAEEEEATVITEANGASGSGSAVGASERGSENKGADSKIRSEGRTSDSDN